MPLALSGWVLGALIGVRVARKATRYAGAGFTSDALPTMRRGESGGLKKTIAQSGQTF